MRWLTMLGLEVTASCVMGIPWLFIWRPRIRLRPQMNGWCLNRMKCRSNNRWSHRSLNCRLIHEMRGSQKKVTVTQITSWRFLRRAYTTLLLLLLFNFIWKHLICNLNLFITLLLWLLSLPTYRNCLPNGLNLLFMLSKIIQIILSQMRNKRRYPPIKH